MARERRPATSLPSRVTWRTFVSVANLARRPCPALEPWVQLLWATGADSAQVTSPYVERVLPTGAMHVVLRLGDSPLALYEDADTGAPRLVGHSVVGGARSSSYVKRAGDSSCSVGVQLRPGAARALLGVPGAELAECHTPLAELWGSDAELLRERLHAIHERALFAAHGAISGAAVLGAQLDYFESFLQARLQRSAAGTNGWLMRAVAALEAGAPLSEIVESSGVSHRAFITRFHDAVGLTPKLFARVRRFQGVVAELAAPEHAGAAPEPERVVSLARVALDAGYADQAHLTRDFRQFADVTPSAYLRLAPASANHLPVRR